jgi:hypothetical protein
MRALVLGALLLLCTGCVGAWGPDVSPPPPPVVYSPAPVVIVPAPVYVVPYYYRPYYYWRR